MTFAEQLASDVANVFCNTDENAIEVLYKQGGVSKWVKGVWSDERVAEEYYDDGHSVQHRANFHLDTTAVGIAAPVVTDRLERDGAEWEVESINGDRSTGMVMLGIVRLTGRKVGRNVHRERF